MNVDTEPLVHASASATQDGAAMGHATDKAYNDAGEVLQHNMVDGTLKQAVRALHSSTDETISREYLQWATPIP